MIKTYFTLFTLLLLASLGNLRGQTDLIISEYVEGWSNNKALEIFNPTNTDIELSNYRIVRYSNGTEAPPAMTQWAVILPSFTLKPYRSYVIVLDKRDPAGTGQEAPIWAQLAQRADVFLCPDYNISKAMYFNGNDAVSLEKKNGTSWNFVDIFARWGAPAPAKATIPGSTNTTEAWTNVAPYVTGAGIALTADHSLIRKSSITSGVTSNPALFNPLAEYDSLSANTFDHLGWHKFDAAPANATPVFEDKLSFDVNASATNGTLIATLAATDAEGDALRYYIDYGNFIYVENVRYEPFALNRETGALTIVDARGLKPDILATFNLKVNVTDGFSQTLDKTVQVNVKSGTGVNDLKQSLQIQLYPNPSTTNQFEVLTNKQIASVRLTNLVGQEVYNQQFDGQTNATIQLKNKNAGNYVVSISFTDGTSTYRKFQIQ